VEGDEGRQSGEGQVKGEKDTDEIVMLVDIGSNL
jgi:hypothetical protein